MKITTISYGETVNLGNYQSCKVELTAEIEPEEAFRDAIEKLKVALKEEIAIIKQQKGCK